MKVSIKEFAVNMEIKNRGVEFEIKGNDGKHRGDLVLSKAGLTWCKGRTTRENGVKMSWSEFIKYMES